MFFYIFLEGIFHVVDLLFYLKIWIQYIHISGQWLNRDLKHAFIKARRLVTRIYGTSFKSVFIFLDAFWQMSTICFFKFSL